MGIDTQDWSDWSDRYPYRQIPWNDIVRMATVIFPIVIGVLLSIYFPALYINQYSDEWNASPGTTGAILMLIRVGLIEFSPLLTVIVGIVAIFLVARNFVNKVYPIPQEDGRLKPIIRLILRQLLGVLPLPPPLDNLWKYPFVLIKHLAIQIKGEEVPLSQHWVSWWGGPANLVIMDGTAVYLERGNRFARVVGPGIAHLERYETIREIVDLRPQTRTGTIRTWTKDGIEVSLDIRIICRIGLDDNANNNEAQIYPCDHLAVKKAVERTAVHQGIKKKNELVEANWLEGIWGQLPGVLSTYVSGRVLDELFFAEGGDDPFLPGLVKDELNRRGGNQIFSSKVITHLLGEMNQHVQAYGVRLTDLHITGHVIPPEVNRQRLNFWGSRWQSYVTRTEGEAKAEQIRVREQALANAQRDLLFAIAEGLEQFEHENLADSLYLTLTGLLDKSIDDPTMRAYMAKEAITTLEKLQELLKMTDQ